MTEEGKARLKEGNIEGAYRGPDGRVHIPGKRVTLYSEPSPPLDELQQVTPCSQCTCRGSPLFFFTPIIITSFTENKLGGFMHTIPALL